MTRGTGDMSTALTVSNPTRWPTRRIALRDELRGHRRRAERLRERLPQVGARLGDLALLLRRPWLHFAALRGGAPHRTDINVNDLTPAEIPFSQTLENINLGSLSVHGSVRSVCKGTSNFNPSATSTLAVNYSLR